MYNPYDDDFDPNEPDVFGDFDPDMKEEKEQKKIKFYRLPRIQVSGGRLHENVDSAEQYLLASGIEIYQRDGRIVRVGTVPIKGQKPTLQFIEVGKENLIETLTSIITFTKLDGRSKKEKTVNCPTDIAATYLDRVGKWQLPVIRAIISAPTLREDGSMLDQPGYDEATGIYYDPQGVEFPRIPAKPTREQARACLDHLIALVSEVPFVVDDEKGEINRSVFLSAELTGLIRTALPSAPMHGFNSPSPGSGKSMLVDTVVTMMTGSPCRALAQGADEEETEKRLASALMAGMAAISFDNCEAPIEGQLLCQAMTQPYLALRRLGKSELVNTANSAIYFATGNNLLITGDMARRAMRCTIDAKCERPEDREFRTRRPDQIVMTDRAEYVMVGLTIMRAFFAAGCPKQSNPPGSFERWSQTVRDCLIWLGEPDPWLTVEAIRQDDPTIERDVAALTAWRNLFEHKAMLTKDVIEAAKKQSEATHAMPSRYVNLELRDALFNVLDNQLNSKALSDWLSRVKGRIIGDYCVYKNDTKRDGSYPWRVECKSDCVKSVIG